MNNQNLIKKHSGVPEFGPGGLTLEDEKIIREYLIEDAAKKPLKDMVQYDVFFGGFDDVIKPSGDGLSYWGGGKTWELRRSNSIRLQFPNDTDPSTVVKALEGLIHLIKQDMRKGYYAEDYRCNNPTIDIIKILKRNKSRRTKSKCGL